MIWSQKEIVLEIKDRLQALKNQNIPYQGLIMDWIKNRAENKDQTEEQLDVGKFVLNAFEDMAYLLSLLGSSNENKQKSRVMTFRGLNPDHLHVQANEWADSFNGNITSANMIFVPKSDLYILTVICDGIDNSYHDRVMLVGSIDRNFNRIIHRGEIVGLIKKTNNQEASNEIIRSIHQLDSNNSVSDQHQA